MDVASAPNRNMIVTDGSVQAIKEADGVVYIGGRFWRAGNWTGGGAIIDANAAAPIGDYPKVNGVVWWSGANMNPKVDRLLTIIDRRTGQIRPSKLAPNINVLCGVANGPECFVGGIFSMIEGEERIGAAAFDAKTGQLTPWNPNVETNVLALAVAGDRVFIGGELQIIGGVPRKNIGAVDRATGALIANWQADAGRRSPPSLRWDYQVQRSHQRCGR